MTLEKWIDKYLPSSIHGILSDLPEKHLPRIVSTLILRPPPLRVLDDGSLTRDRLKRELDRISEYDLSFFPQQDKFLSNKRFSDLVMDVKDKILSYDDKLINPLLSVLHSYEGRFESEVFDLFDYFVTNYSSATHQNLLLGGTLEDINDQLTLHANIDERLMMMLVSGVYFSDNILVKDFRDIDYEQSWDDAQSIIEQMMIGCDLNGSTFATDILRAINLLSLRDGTHDLFNEYLYRSIYSFDSHTPISLLKDAFKREPPEIELVQEWFFHVDKDNPLKEENDVLYRGKRYGIKKLLGKGMQGNVYLAGNFGFEEEIIDFRAVKIHLPKHEYFTDKTFQAEINQLVRAKDLGITIMPMIYRHGGEFIIYKGKNILAYEMEYVKGDTLVSLYDKNLADKQKLMIITQLLKGIYDCNRNNIYHHDVNPYNILVTSEGVVKLLDFGVSDENSKQPEEFNNRHGNDIIATGIIYDTMLNGYPFGNKENYPDTMTFKQAVKKAKEEVFLDGKLSEEFIKRFENLQTVYEPAKLTNFLISMYENRPFEELRSQIIDIDLDMQPLLIDKKDLTARLWG